MTSTGRLFFFSVGHGAAEEAGRFPAGQQRSEREVFFRAPSHQPVGDRRIKVGGEREFLCLLPEMWRGQCQADRGICDVWRLYVCVKEVF